MSATHEVAFSVDPALRSFLPRIGYVLDFLSNHPNAPVGGVRWTITDKLLAHAIVVSYGYESEKARFHIPAQRVVFQNTPLEIAALITKGYQFEGNALFSVEKSENNISAISLPFISSNMDDAKHFGFDWIETLFFYLSRLEEYQAPPQDLDEHGILPSDRQFLVKHQLHHRPVIDHLVHAIYLAIGLRPQERSTSWTITHDIDHLRLFSPHFKLWRYLGGMAYRHRSFRGWLPLLRRYWACRWRGASDPYLDFSTLFAKNQHLERVVYLAAVQEPYALDPSYQLDEPRIREIWDRAKRLGYQLGLHPDYRTWQDGTRFQDALADLQQWSGTAVKHTRQHYLRFAFPETADIIEQTGFVEDSTLGYRDRIGFRCGTGFAYHLYNFAAEKAYNWLEKPLIVMDIALLRESAFDADTMRQLWKEFVLANQKGTHITVNFHNSVFFEPEIHGIPLLDLYRDLLHNLSQNSFNQ